MLEKSLSIEAAGLSHQGLVREQNEDRFVIDQSIGCYLVADGMGGHQAGEVASRIAAEVISNKIARLEKKSRIDPSNALRDAILSAHQAIRKQAHRTISHQGMGSTIVILWQPATDNEMWLAHVGDSRTYLLRGTDFIRLTEDHTIFNQAKKAGLLGDDPTAYPPRSMLSQALGASDVIAPDLTRIDMEDGDTFLLCSDGLTDMLLDEQIETVLRSGSIPADLCQKLIQAALDQGGKDNVSVVLLQIHAALI